MATSQLGNIKNKPVCVFGVSTIPQAQNSDLTKGQLTYQNGALGLTIVPITAQPAASEVRIIEHDSKNNPGSLGGKSVDTYKTHCIAVIKLDGIISIGGKGRASTITTGRGEKLDDPPNSTTPTAGEVDAIRDFNKFYLFDYLGHTDEYLNANKVTTDGADGDEIVVAFK